VDSGRPFGDTTRSGDTGEDNASHESDSAEGGGPGDGATTTARPRSVLPRLVVALIVVALVASAWVFLELRGSTEEATGTVPTSSDPVSEYPPSARGEPVQLAGSTLTDDLLDVADLRGHVVVINVWGSWCVPCREEAPVLARLSREYTDDGVRFVGVNVKDNRAAALAFEDRYGIPYPSIEDRDGQALLALSQHVPAQAVPVTLVLDSEGRVAARVIGLVREATLRALLEGVLAEGAA
jgi:thiol-disulfide isomerase/thioredoxin